MPKKGDNGFSSENDPIDSDLDQTDPDSGQDEYAGAHVILREVGAFIAYVSHRFNSDRCLRMAAGLSYTSLLAIVPLTAIAFSMLAAFPVFEGVRGNLQEALFSNLLPQTAEATRDYFNQFVQNTTTLSAVGIVALALTAILLLGTIEADMNTIFRVIRARAMVPRLLVFWALLTLGPLLLGASFSLSGYIFAATQWMGIDTAGGLGGYLIALLPTIMIIVMLTTFYVIIPNRNISLTAGLIGGVTAGILFTLLRKVFGWYIITFPTYQNIYGALSVVPIFLIWMYLSWLIVLMGAVLTASTNEWQSAGGKPMASNVSAGARLVAAMQILGVLYEASKDGTGAVRRNAILRKTGGGGEAVDSILHQLRIARFVERTSANRWILARNPETTKVAEVHSILRLGFGDVQVPNDGSKWQSRFTKLIEDLRTNNKDALSISLRDVFEEPETKPEIREVQAGED
jgi:membrane protein